MGLLLDDERFTYGCLVYWPFSVCNLAGSGVGFVKNIGHWREKTVLVVTGVLMGLPGVLCWLHFYKSPDFETKAWGWFYLAVGGHEVLIFPVVLIFIAKLYNKFDDEHLSDAIMSIFKR